jgi:hypothetical protein
MKKYVQMDDPHCEHLGECTPQQKGPKLTRVKLVHHASWMVCGQNVYFFIVFLSPS